MTSSLSRLSTSFIHPPGFHKDLPLKTTKMISSLVLPHLMPTQNYSSRQCSYIPHARSLFLLNKNRDNPSYQEQLGLLKSLPRHYSAATSKLSTFSFKHQSMIERSIATKTASWRELMKGDCHQIDGTLILQSDGNAHFTCVTWTDSTHSGDYWHVGFEFRDSSGVILFDSPMHTGPRMDDGHPSPRYRWGFDFTFDPSIYERINQINQGCSC